MLNRTMSFDSNIKINVLITETFKERNRGLLALKTLDSQQGLLITPCRSVHTFGMRYSLDLVYLSKDLVIVKLVKNVTPNRMSIAIKAYCTLEIQSGEIERLNLQTGMQAYL